VDSVSPWVGADVNKSTTAGATPLYIAIGNGEAVQVDPIKPTLKPPGTNRLKLGYDEPPSNFAFNVKLRRYTMGTWM
jgi:hypothetical protein